MKKIVVIGGGTGLSTLLRSIRDYPIDIAAVVTMADDGKSTGQLRRDFEMLPPGDIRKCIAALSDKEDLLLDLFQYRFKKGVGLKGHSMGNLLISAAQDIYGNFELATEGICKILSIKGRVIPSTLQQVCLNAKFDNGKRVKGESKITKYGYNHKIENIYFSQKKAKANNKALEAIDKADYIFVGPGSLFTSIIPNFLLSDILRHYKKSKAVKTYVCNVSTERGETDEFTLNNHLEVLTSYGLDFDIILANNKNFRSGHGDGYIKQVIIDQNTESLFSSRLVAKDLINNKNPLYHEIDKIGKEIWAIILKYKKSRL